MKVFKDRRYVKVSLSGQDMWLRPTFEEYILGIGIADTLTVKIGQENLLLLSATEKFLDGGYLGPK